MSETITQPMTHGLSRNRTILATAGTMLALLLAALDQTIVGTAIPRIVADLNGLDRLAWVTTAYLVTSTTMTPIAGKLGDLFGRKPFLLAGMIGFVVPCSPSLEPSSHRPRGRARRACSAACSASPRSSAPPPVDSSPTTGAGDGCSR